MYKKLKNLWLTIFNFIFVYTVIGNITVLAQASTNEETKIPKIPNISTLPSPYKDSDVTEIGYAMKDTFLPKVAMTVIRFAIPLTVLFMIIGAIQFLTAYGNDEKLGNAKNTIVYALIGLVLSLLSYAIVQLVFHTGYYGFK